MNLHPFLPKTNPFRRFPGSQSEGLQAWRHIWIPILLEGLKSPDEHLRHRVSLYAVPVPLGLDQASLLPLLQEVLKEQPGQPDATDAQVSLQNRKRENRYLYGIVYGRPTDG